MEDKVQVFRYLEIDTDSEAERTVRLIHRVTQYKEGITVRRDSAVLWDEQQTTCAALDTRRAANFIIGILYYA